MDSRDFLTPPSVRSKAGGFDPPVWLLTEQRLTAGWWNWRIDTLHLESKYFKVHVCNRVAYGWNKNKIQIHKANIDCLCDLSIYVWMKQAKVTQWGVLVRKPAVQLTARWQRISPLAVVFAFFIIRSPEACQAFLIEVFYTSSWHHHSVISQWSFPKGQQLSLSLPSSCLFVINVPGVCVGTSNDKGLRPLLLFPHSSSPLLPCQTSQGLGAISTKGIFQQRPPGSQAGMLLLRCLFSGLLNSVKYAARLYLLPLHVTFTEQ